MPHTRLRAPGEIYFIGSVRVEAIGGERVSDTRHDVPVHHPSSVLCEGHSRWLAELIDQTPEVVRWLRACVRPGPGQPQEIKRTSTDSAAPCELAAIDAADRELATLARWAGHAGAPAPVGVRRIGGEVRGFRSTDTRAVQLLARWTSARLSAIEGFPWVLDMLQEMTVVRGAHLRRWPLVDQEAA
ncbi:hypothetical protein [Nocardia sp. CS682]|uniref:hypothetical protein n=1 Tax=Nocardia sp. CS682 TaxID=1047172 RepID=UPI001074D32B|nr:hypothetical protein [Nocardia sp. CS682]QBS43852.1 hypothetical protein DMB37_30895 [Nocardia sp. CS682]